MILLAKGLKEWDVLKRPGCVADNDEGRSVAIVNPCQSSAGRSFVNLLESLDILEKAAFNASSSGSNSSALAFICFIE